jgi:hypothetical protein
MLAGGVRGRAPEDRRLGNKLLAPARKDRHRPVEVTCRPRPRSHSATVSTTRTARAAGLPRHLAHGPFVSAGRRDHDLTGAQVSEARLTSRMRTEWGQSPVVDTCLRRLEAERTDVVVWVSVPSIRRPNRSFGTRCRVVSSRLHGRWKSPLGRRRGGDPEQRAGSTTGVDTVACGGEPPLV